MARFALQVCLTLSLTAASLAAGGRSLATTKVEHVLVLLVDGLHSFDLQWLVKNRPLGYIAQLAKSGVTYTQAHHAVNSDSFPGIAYYVTGASPATTGVWYEQTYDSTLYAPGSNCAPSGLGTEIDYSEAISYNANDPYGGGGINASLLPQQKAGSSCLPLYPHQYFKVNNVFEVIKQHLHGSYTAFADKTQGYEFLQGISGKGVDDLNNLLQVAPYTKDPAGAQLYDNKKALFVINQINGRTSNGTKKAPVPTIFGANFQSVSVNQKLNQSTSVKTGLTDLGGYANSADTPNPLTVEALDFIDNLVGDIFNALAVKGLQSKTAIILAGKHGNSPANVKTLRRVDSNVFNTIAATVNITIPFADTDTGGFFWLSPSDRKAGKAVVLAGAFNAAISSGAFGDIGLTKATAYSGTDPRHPDVIGATEIGTLFSKNLKKIEDHGGYNEDDVHVGLVVSIPGSKAGVYTKAVTTSQVAPTILSTLGLATTLLDGVKIEKTAVLPTP